MDIERAAWRNIEQPLRKDEPVRGDHQGIGAGGCDALNVLQGLGLKKRQAALDRQPLHGTCARLQAAAGAAIGPREHQCDLVAGFEQTRQRLLGEWRGAGEN